ncbi:TraR/DksA family transcriptional regulator [Roseicyclus sp.]|uniref:TraR/DksA family transcriptional regulator n=1 Tax=Roseicyclus sp. TaxID=1914329 RepID=UPI003FA0D627
MNDSPEPTQEELAARFLPRLQAELRALEDASERTADDRRPVELDQQSVGRLSRMDALQQQAMAAAQDARRHARGRAVAAAMLRMESGEFGFCDACGGFIGLARLDLEPTVMRCRDCAR